MTLLTTALALPLYTWALAIPLMLKLKHALGATLLTAQCISLLGASPP